MKIGFGLMLDKNSSDFAIKLEKELCKKFSVCWGLNQAPHIAIKRPFETNNIKEFEDYLDIIANKSKSFKVNLKGIGSFEEHTIFMDVIENKALTELHFKILDDLKEKGVNPNKFEREKVKFHSTLATRDLDKEKFYLAQEYLKQYKIDFTFEAKEIGLFYYLEDKDEWIVTKVVSLK
jgi:2'-5' RNA ligase